MGCQTAPPPDAAELMDRAVRAVERNDLTRAKSLLDELLKHHPRHGKALLYRAQCAWDEQDADLALELLGRVTDESNTLSGTARYLEGDILLSRGDARQAEACWEEAIRLHPKFARPRERLARLYLLQFRGEEAEKLLISLRQIRPWTLPDYVLWQLAQSGAGQAKDAETELEKFVAAHPEDDVSRRALARVQIVQRDFAKAAETLEQEVAAKSPDSQTLGFWAWAHWQSGNVERVLEKLPKTWPKDDADAWLWRSYGRIALDGEDWPGAAHCWEQVVRKSPDDREAAYSFGQALERCGRAEAAQQQFADARQLEELITHVQHLLEGQQQRTDLVAVMIDRIIHALRELRRPEQAAAWLELLAAWNPGDPGIQRRLQENARTKPDSVHAKSTTALVRQLRSERPAAPAFDRDFSKVRRTTSESLAAESGIRLEDVGAAAGLDFQHFNGPTENKYLLESLGGAVAVLDYDGDGWPDLYFPQGCRIPYQASDREHLDQLYRNRGDGRYENVTLPAGIFENRYSQGVAAGDFNHDGFCDVFVANFGENVLWQNNGDGTFTDVTATSGLFGDDWSSSAAWSDLDGDGDLDLYVVTYVKDPYKICRKPDGTIAACSPGNFEGAPDQLFVNLGDGTFAEWLEAAGLAAPNGKGLGIITADFDNDGRADIYVANDGTPNFLFHNLGSAEPGTPRFEEIGLASGAALSKDGRAQAGMGIACADFNGDGRLDLYVTNFYEDYNTLYLNQGSLFFEDATRSAGMLEPSLPMLGFGTQAIDWNLDRLPDLLVANGHIDNHSSEGIPWKMPAQVYQNLGQAAFRDVSTTTSAFFREKALGRAAARLDFNRDGRPDAVIVHQDRPAALLENRTEVPHPAIRLRLVGEASNRDALGARVIAEFPDGEFMTYVCGGDGYFATNDRRLLIGTGSFAQSAKLTIVWPSGRRTELNDVPAGKSFLVFESGRVLPENDR